MIIRKSIVLAVGSSLVFIVSCSKRHSKAPAAYSAGVTEATETTRLAFPVVTSALAISSIDIFGANNTSGASLKLTSGTDFDNDRGYSWMSDSSMQSLSSAEYIICFISQSGYVSMVNKGPFVAQINLDTCEHNFTSGSSSKNLVSVTFDVTRLDDYAPLIVKSWSTEKDEYSGTTNTSANKMIITEGQSTKNPLGIFSLTWEGKEGSNVADKGYIKVKRSSADGKLSMSMFDTYAYDVDTFIDDAMTAELVWNESLQLASSGKMRSTYSDWDSETQKQKIGYLSSAFSPTRLSSKKDTGETECLAKDDYNYSVWSYGLYKTDGSRLKRNDSLSIYTEKDGVKSYGYASSSYVSLPFDAAVADNMVVHSADPETSVVTDYKVRVGPADLTKYTLQTKTLLQMKDIEMSVNTEAGSFIIKYDGSAFQKVAIRNDDGSLTATTGAFSFPTDRGDHALNYFYSETLNTDISIYSSAAGVPENSATYYTVSSATLSLGKVLLYCYDNCVQGNITKDLLEADTETGLPKYIIQPNTDGVDPSDAAAYAEAKKVTYEYDPATLTLSLVSGDTRIPVRIKEGEDLTQFESFSYYIGQLTPTPRSDLSDGTQAAVFYFWPINNNSGGYFKQLLKSNNEPVAFDPPLVLSYTHTAANDRSGGVDHEVFYGKQYDLTYYGFGNLTGIPYHTGTDFYGPEFALKDGVAVGNYKAKALGLQMSMKTKAAEECTAIVPDETLLMPTLDGYKAPEIGDAPVVTSVPAVIEGVVQ